MAEVSEKKTSEKEAAPVKAEEKKPVLYRCVTECWTKGRLFRVGDTALFDGPAPEYFVKVKVQ